MGLIQSAEGLKKNTNSHKEEEILPTDCPLTLSASALPSVSSVPANPADSGLGQLSQSCVHVYIVVVVLVKSHPTLLQPHGLQPARFLCTWDFAARILERLPFPSPGDILHPGIKPAPPRLAGEFFTTKPPRKPPFFPVSLENSN